MYQNGLAFWRIVQEITCSRTHLWLSVSPSVPYFQGRRPGISFIFMTNVYQKARQLYKHFIICFIFKTVKFLGTNVINIALLKLRPRGWRHRYGIVGNRRTPSFDRLVLKWLSIFYFRGNVQFCLLSNTNDVVATLSFNIASHTLYFSYIDIKFFWETLIFIHFVFWATFSNMRIANFKKN